MNSISVLDTSEQAKLKIESAINEAFKVALKPPPNLTLVEWADEHRYLPDNSAEPGRWKTDRVEVSRGPMLSVSDKTVQEVTVMSCIQLLKTELMLNTALYYIHQEPSPIMYVAEKGSMAEAWSKERLVKSVSATPAVADCFSRNRRGEGNTILQKQFPGGQISIVSAQNPGDLAMRAVRILLFDEVDKYPHNVGAGDGGSGGEGDPLAVAFGRSTTYGKRAKKIAACSPTVEGKSRIEAEYFKSDQRKFYQPCPHCGHAKPLEWPDVHIPKDEGGTFLHEKAAIVCSNQGCGAVWTEGDRIKSIRNGYWVAAKPEITWHHGYHVTSLASPFTPVVELAKEFSDAQGNPESLKAFYNTRMAKTWKEVGEQPDWKVIYERRENYTIAQVPDGALILTCGIDVQKDYLVYEVVGWGARRQSWSIDKGVIQGKIEDDTTKEALYQFIDQEYVNSSGINMQLNKVCIDSGYNTNEVYSAVRQYPGRADFLISVKGDKEGNLSTVLGTPRPVDVNIDGKRIARGLMNWMVGSSVCKEQFYRWLNLPKPTDEELKKNEGKYPSGYCHFPQYDEEYFKQITAEQYVMKTNKRGFHSYEWEKLRQDNHFLDCRVYARAGFAMLMGDRMTDEDWSNLEAMYHPDTIESKPASPAPTRKRKNKGFLKRGRR